MLVFRQFFFRKSSHQAVVRSHLSFFRCLRVFCLKELLSCNCSRTCFVTCFDFSSCDWLIIKKSSKPVLGLVAQSLGFLKTAIYYRQKF